MWFLQLPLNLVASDADSLVSKLKELDPGFNESDNKCLEINFNQTPTSVGVATINNYYEQRLYYSTQKPSKQNMSRSLIFVTFKLKSGVAILLAFRLDLKKLSIVMTKD